MNIDKYRSETPGIKNVIHLNNAGASLQPLPVYNTVIEYLNAEMQMGGYETADKYKQAIENFYENTARLINAQPQEIAFTESATHAWDMAFYSIPFKKGDVILTSRIEYASNYIAYLQMKKRKGVIILPVDSNEFGEIDLENLEKHARNEKVKLISITHMPTNGGIVNPAEEVGKIAVDHGIIYMLDACQSAGQYPLNVKKLKCDFLSATGRKYLRGPRGTGFLYANSNLFDKIEPFSLDLHSASWTSSESYKIREDAKRFEKWECNLAAKTGLGRAMEYCMNVGIENIWNRVQELGFKLRSGLKDIPGIEVLDIGRIQSGIVTFRHNKIPASEIRDLLFSEKINTTVAVANGTLLDMQDRNIDTALRASVHYFNTEEEIGRLIEVVSKKVVQQK